MPTIRCQCPKDGSSYCEWCQALAQRAGMVLPRTGKILPQRERQRDAAELHPYNPSAPHTLPVALVSPSQGDGYRSKTERRYAEWLTQQQQQGAVITWRYEAMRLRLAPATTLTVDFMVILAEGLGDDRIQLHEVKGAWIREKSWQKLKIAAALYSEFRFIKAQWLEGAWQWQDIPAT